MGLLDAWLALRRDLTVELCAPCLYKPNPSGMLLGGLSLL